MDELLINILEEAYGYPVRLQGSFRADESYPSHFFTFWNNSSDGDSFYDNDEGAIVWDYDLNFYSNNPQLVNTMLIKAKALLKSKGFTVNGAGHDVTSDEPTHTGRGITVIYRQEQ